MPIPTDGSSARCRTDVVKRFVQVGDGRVHYRVAGTGPAIVMLHDSPRSSRLHLATMTALAATFRVYALDTPGYGNSTPLALADPTIADFGRALGEVLAVLGLKDAPLYATHTSAKIALDHAATSDRAPPLLVLDGLSIPERAPDEAFIAAYMRPFRLDAAGAYLAAEWTRMRDMQRWFPWFDARPERRMATAAPSAAWLEAYVLDLLSAGPHYADAYAAAMRYDPRDALRRVASPVIVAARADDVLFRCLDLLPEDRSPSITVQRLSADRDDWLGWLGTTLTAASPGPPVAEMPSCAGQGPVYVDLPHGQMLVHRAGQGARRPLLILETPSTLHARLWQTAMADTRRSIVPELPGYGESDPIADGVLADHADAVVAMLRLLEVDSVDILAIGLAAPLATAIALGHPARVSRLIFDGLPLLDVAERASLADRLCPRFVQDAAGGHLHAIWHMLRDGEAQWPWFDDGVEVQRRLMPVFEPEPLHRALLDILKQPAHYGDAALAGLSAATSAIDDLTQPVELFDLPGDPGYRGVAGAAERIARSRIVVRPPDIASAAAWLASQADAD